MKYAIKVKGRVNLIEITSAEALRRPDVIKVPETAKNGDVFDGGKYVTLEAKSDPEYKKLIDKEDLTKIKTGVITSAEQQKLLVAIALKLKVI